MLRLWTLLFLLSAHSAVFGQQDTLPKKKDGGIKNKAGDSARLTRPQQRWLNTNYKLVAGLKKDSASTVIRKTFTSINESSLEFMISLAAKLQKGDNQQQLAKLAQQLEQLKRQKQAFLLHLQHQEDQLSKETDPGKRRKIENKITDLKTNIRLVEDTIRNKEEAIRLLEGVT